ncbi:calcitonin gene-related peptide type 1 receptor-like isoform X2 [Portunus trituberculatus]|uniref:calcitonin gene-related peptide type 1 receptor-like isoform X2 n=1 Tax=Portunus trituberculatus TaxID=210409 RepID=UPI001E1CD2C6|nr:calcitonin gene-related peptide type 1 receptor-like isoform X2 [Portunus trituberculatus]
MKTICRILLQRRRKSRRRRRRKEVDKEVEMEGEENISSNSSHSLAHFFPKFLPPILSEQDLKEIRSPLCRSKERYLPPDLFHLDTCALCYHHLVNKDVFASKWRIQKVARKAPLGRKDNGTMGEGGGGGGGEPLERKQTRLEEAFTFLLHVLVDPDNENVTLEAQMSSSALLESFKGEEGRDKWKKCCKEAVSCCTWMLSASWPAGFCPNTWDTWQCWPASSPGTVAQRPCPSYVYFDKKPACTKKATKSCEMDGKWMRRLLSGGVVGPEWSNYSTCSVHENIHRRLHVHIAAYTVSVFALLPALCIFFCYKQLRVPRITLHKHLFLSLLLNAAGVIAQRLLQLHYSQWIEKSPLWCVALTLINRYTSLTCYMWYFCEGLYLHTLLVSAFTEQRSLLMFYLIGWGLPAVVMVVYGGLRSLLQLGDERCWMLPADGGLNWLINLPPLLAILANIVFLFNIIRILVSKVRAGRGSEPSQYRKAVRATLMVVPLFGLQYVVTLYRIQEMGCDWPHVYQLANNIIEGSTGWLVAVIFCYTNGEVLSLLWRSIQRRRTLHKLGRRGGAEGQMTPAPAPLDAKGSPPTALAPEGVL